MVENLTFNDYYLSQEMKEKKRIRKEFLEANGLSYTAFYSKLTRRNFSKLERTALEGICNRKFNW